MTIRLHCAECRRKLKVPDAARGRRVQCPVCGARFRESGSPLVADRQNAGPTADAGTNGGTGVSPVKPETALIDALFADATSSSFSIPEDPAAPEEITIPAPPPPPPAPASPSIPDLELEEPQAEAEAAEFEPLVSKEEGTEEPTLVEEAIEEEMMEITDEAEELDAVEVVDDTGEVNALASFEDLDETEVMEAVEPEEKEEKRSKKKKKKGFFSSLFGRKKARDADD
ncbi:MAG TPA: hypothetical protein VH682_09235 [Gemmataceae bacterium]|jgi:type IV secretory pathway VirB10-like protein